MSLPNAASAVIDPAKIRDYVLSSAHPVGRFKAAFFTALGYTAENWAVLREHLPSLAQAGKAVPGQVSLYGQKFEVDGMLTGPLGRSAEVRTIWIVGTDDEFPRVSQVAHV